MLEKWKKLVDRAKTIGALSTDLSNTFNFLDHELLIAKLNHSMIICQIEIN